jgi:hypothetical protein
MVVPSINPHHEEPTMFTAHFHETTTATPAQYVAGLTDFGPARAALQRDEAQGARYGGRPQLATAAQGQTRVLPGVVTGATRAREEQPSWRRRPALQVLRGERHEHFNTTYAVAAAGIFLDVFNVFLLALDLFGGQRD